MFILQCGIGSHDMGVCETCGDVVPHRFEHRVRDDVMTHCRIQLVCADCHPNLSADLKYEPPSRVVGDGEAAAH